MPGEILKAILVAFGKLFLAIASGSLLAAYLLRC